MLHFLRKGVKSLPAKILIGLLVASFAVWGIGDIFSFRLDSRVAKVGDTEVPAERLVNALVREQSRMSRQAGQLISFDMMRAAGLDQRILGGLIRDAAFDEELAGLGISAPDEAVADAIRSNPTFQGPGGQFSQQAYQIFMAQQNLLPAEFEALTRTLLSQQILSETMQATAATLPGAAARLAAYQGENRAASSLTLGLDRVPDPGMPGEGALREFYEANPAMFTEPERRWGEFVHVDAAKLLDELAPEDAVLREQYEANIDAYTVAPSRTVDQIPIPDRETAEAAMARLISGAATFESLGEEFGIGADALSIGRITADDLPEAAAAVVFDATEPGIIGPVEMPAGFAVFRVAEVSEGGAAPFEDIRDALAAQAATDALVVRAPEIANEIEELRAEGLTLAEVAQRTGATYGRIEGLARDASLPGDAAAEGFVASPVLIAEAFEALDAEERDLVDTPEGGYFVVMIERIEPSALQPLETVRDRATAEWQTAERLKALEAMGAELVARLGTDASIWDIGEELGLIAQVHESFTRMTPPELPPALVEDLFTVETSAGAMARSDDGSQVIIAQVTAVTALAPEAVESTSEQIDQAIAASLSQDLNEFYARGVVDRYEARIDVGVVDQVFQTLGAASQASQ